jgi:hypothetical protein
MKKLFVLFSILICTVSINAQDVFNSNDESFEKQWIIGEITNIIIVDSSITKDQLYSQLQDWIANTFNSAKSVIQISDKDLGKIVGNGCVPVNQHPNVFIGGLYMIGYGYFTINVQCKNGKYKYTINNLYFENQYNTSGKIPLQQEKSGQGMNIPQKQWDKIKNDAKIQIYSTIESLKLSMNKVKSEKKDSW